MHLSKIRSLHPLERAALTASAISETLAIPVDMISGFPVLAALRIRGKSTQSKTWDDIGAAKWLGSLEDLQNEELINEFNVLRNNEQNLALMSVAGSRLVDGNGAHKIAKIFSQDSSLN